MSRYSRLYCKSGFSMSVQASKTNYSSPRDNTGPYTAVEIGFPSAAEPLIIGYAEDQDNPTETIYGWVPAGLVKALIIKHNGIEEGEVPPLDIDLEQSTILAESLFEVNNESC
jgi:hypothetical protein